MNYPTHCMYVFCVISREKLCIFLKSINRSVLCNGHTVCQCVVMAVTMKATLFGDVIPCSLMKLAYGRSENSRKHGVCYQETVNFRFAVIFVW